MEKKTEVATATRAEKKDRAKNLIRETLSKKEYKHNELIDETAKLYAERFAGEETDNINDVRGRIGSILDVMKKEGEILYDGGVYALKAETETEKPKKTTRKTKKKAEETPEKEKTEASPKKRVGRKKKTEETVETEEPVLPVDPVPAPVVIPDPESTKTEVPKEITAKKRGGRKKKTEEKKEEAKEVKEEVKTEEPVLPQPIEETKTEEIPESKAETAVVVVPKGEIAEKNVVDMSFLFGSPAKTANAPAKTEVVPVKVETKPSKAEPKPVKTETKPIEKKPAPVKKQETKKPTRTMTADERLKESYLKRLHRLGGDYFEYYSVYLLERYCRNNGRRLEGLKITAGDRDGGIDGEIELTDKFGFRETIYIQAKNWDPEKGDEKLWVVGETLVQQFIGACACRQAKEGKQRCRGIFITTSRFTPEAKAVLDTMSEQIIGYDGSDLYEAAKECQFGIIKRNGEWVLDENLLSSGKVFFTMF